MSCKSDRYYHYTSVSGCLGIIKSRSIWLTDYRFLNDKLELRQGINSFLSRLPDDKKNSFERAFQWHDMQNHHCVFSLSHSPDILSQWRAYASDGEGIALGLNRTFLEHAGLSLVECRYENHEDYASELVSKHEDFLDEVHNASNLHVAENSFMDWIRSNSSGFYEIIEDLIALKNPAFSEEKELRAIWSKPMRDEAIKMREARNLIIPYVEAEIWPDEDKEYLSVVIPEIWLGPKCNDLNRMSLLAMNIGNIKRHDCGYI